MFLRDKVLVASRETSDFLNLEATSFHGYFQPLIAARLVEVAREGVIPQVFREDVNVLFYRATPEGEEVQRLIRARNGTWLSSEEAKAKILASVDSLDEGVYVWPGELSDALKREGFLITSPHVKIICENLLFEGKVSTYQHRYGCATSRLDDVHPDPLPDNVLYFPKK